MEFKNVAYHRVEAVLEDGKTVVGFEPGEVHEIPDDQKERMEARYPHMLVEVGTMITADPVVVEPENKVPTSLDSQELRTPDEIMFPCDECDFKAKSKLGLIGHKRSHLK